MPPTDLIYHHAKGTIEKTISCEQCGSIYVYQTTRVAWVTVDESLLPFPKSSQEMKKARQKAENDLPGVLDRAVDPVPCPVCGWYQSNMIPLVRKALYEWMILVAVFLGFIGCLLFPVTVHFNTDSAKSILDGILIAANVACFLIAGGLVIIRSICCARYDPNEDDRIIRIADCNATVLRYTPSDSDRLWNPPTVTHVPRRLTSEAKGWIGYFLFLVGLTGVGLYLAGDFWPIVYFLGFFVWGLNVSLCWAWYHFRKEELPSDQSPLFMPVVHSPDDPLSKDGPASWRVNLLLVFLGLIVMHGGLLLELVEMIGIWTIFPYAGTLTLIVGLGLFVAGFHKKSATKK
jgi:hypothetical protein